MGEDQEQTPPSEVASIGCLGIVMIAIELVLVVAAIVCFVFTSTIAGISPGLPRASANVGVTLLALAAAGELLRRLFGWAFRQ